MTVFVCVGPTIIGQKTFGHSIAMHPTIVTMMISVFRGPSVPPVGSLCRLLAVVAIVVATVSGTSETSETDGFHSYFLSCLFDYRFHTDRGEEMPFASRSLVNAFLAKNFQFSPLYVCRLANCRKIPATQPQAFRQFSLNFSFSRTTDRNDQVITCWLF